MNSLRTSLFLWAAFAALSAPSTVHAMALAAYPVELKLQEGKPGFYHVKNQSDKAIAIVVQASKWVLGKDGGETNPATEDLVVYPEHFILKGHQERKIKVSHPAPLTGKEKAYRVLIRELPVQLEAKSQSSGVYMAIAYKTACYVTPKRGQPKIVLSSASFTTDGIHIEVSNKGSVHQHLAAAQLFFKDHTGETIAISPKEVTAVMDKENVHAGATREFLIPFQNTLQNPLPKTLLLTYKDEDGRTISYTTALQS